MPATESQIRERAYLIWESTGRPAGREKDHWFQAMEELAADAATTGAVARLRRAVKAAAPKPAAPKPSARSARKH